MFKSFTGYHLVERYHARKHEGPKKSVTLKALKIVLVTLVSVVL